MERDWQLPESLEERLWSRIYDKIHHDHKKLFIVPSNFAEDADEIKEFEELLRDLEDKRLVVDRTKRSWRLLSEDVSEYKEALGVGEKVVPNTY